MEFTRVGTAIDITSEEQFKAFPIWKIEQVT